MIGLGESTSDNLQSLQTQLKCFEIAAEIESLQALLKEPLNEPMSYSLQDIGKVEFAARLLKALHARYEEIAELYRGSLTESCGG